jgi:hypothetical protein
MKRKFLVAMLAAAPFLVAALPAQADADYRAKAIAMIQKDFKPRGQAGLDRLAEDGVQAICNRTGDKPPEAIAKVLEADQLASVKWPADGKLMGDWKKGEKLYAGGFGMRIGKIEPDPVARQKGGNGGEDGSAIQHDLLLTVQPRTSNAHAACGMELRVVSASGGRRCARPLRAAVGSSDRGVRGLVGGDGREARDQAGKCDMRRAGQRLGAALHAASGGAGAAGIAGGRPMARVGAGGRAQQTVEGGAGCDRQRQQQGLQRDHVGREQRQPSPGTDGFAHRPEHKRFAGKRPPAGRRPQVEAG